MVQRYDFLKHDLEESVRRLLQSARTTTPSERDRWSVHPGHQEASCENVRSLIFQLLPFLIVVGFFLFFCCLSWRLDLGKVDPGNVPVPG